MQDVITLEKFTTRRLHDQNKLMREFIQLFLHDISAPIANVNQFFLLLNKFNDYEKILLLPKLKELSNRSAMVVSEMKTVFEDINDTSENTNFITVREIVSGLEKEFGRDIIASNAKIILKGNYNTDFTKPEPLLKSILKRLLNNSLKYCSTNNPPEITIIVKKNYNEPLQINYCDKREKTTFPEEDYNLHVLKSLLVRTGGNLVHSLTENEINYVITMPG